MSRLPAPTGTWNPRIASISVLLHRRSWLLTLAILALLAGLALLALSLGSGQLGPREALATLLGQGSRMQEILLFKIRLPRVAAAIVAGLAMGMAGCLIQTLVRNRLLRAIGQEDFARLQRLAQRGNHAGAQLVLQLFTRLLAAAQHAEADHVLPLQRIGHPDASCLGHGRVAHQNSLHLGRPRARRGSPGAGGGRGVARMVSFLFIGQSPSFPP